MNFQKIKYIIGVLLSSGLIFSSISLQPVPAGGSQSDTFKFERMWPVLQQPWYFKFPNDIALDRDGNVYVIDLEMDRIQKFSSEGRFILKWGVRGSGEGKILSPTAIAVDDSGYVYVADSLNYRIQKFTPDGQYVTGWETDGSETEEYDGFKGMDIDSTNTIYVTDHIHHTIQKYATDGTLIGKWGSFGSGDGQLASPGAIASDNNGHVYVVDTQNHRIQKFTTEGTFVLQWGQKGDDNDAFDFGPEDAVSSGGICVGKDGFIYVSDTYNGCIKKFTSQGAFVAKYGIAAWQYTGTENLVFDLPSGLETDKMGVIYVADIGNSGITKFSDDRFIANWGGPRRDTGAFDHPSGIATDKDGYVYISDTNNHRIQKFSSTGAFINTWGKNGGTIGNFDSPKGIAADHNGFIYVSDSGNNRIQKFSQDGSYLSQWGTKGSGPGEFSEPWGIAVDSSGKVYVADTNNYRIQVFSSNGTYLSEWGAKGTGNGQFEYPAGVAADSEGNVYVADENNDCIQKFTSEGIFIAKLSGDFNTDEPINDPVDVDIDNDGNLYVADRWGTRILVFTSKGELKEVLGAMGTDPGMFSLPVSISVSPSGDRLYVGESPNNRIQVFSKTGASYPNPVSGISKAIIVAGGGAYAGNTLWDATQVCTNYAYRVLTYQGYTKDRIYYLSSDTDLDMDGNGQLDDVDMDATNANLEYAITTWAKDADNLLIYITDHGGNKTFRMSQGQLLDASDLDAWLDKAEESISENVSLIYDACQSGSFLPEMTPAPDKERIVITSAMDNQNAFFTSLGSLSFSYLFWGNIFAGMSIGDAFILAKNSIEYTYTGQTPLLDDTGNGIGNENEDGTLAKTTYVGNSIISADDIPFIGTVSPEQTITDGGTSATVTAEEITDANGISRVWAVIMPPGKLTSDPSEPVLTVPMLEMTPDSSGKYTGTYNDFSASGTYGVSVFAEDIYGNTSLPVSTSVTQTEGTDSIIFNTDPKPTDTTFAGLFTDTQGETRWYQLWTGDASGNHGEYVDTSKFNSYGNGWISKTDIELLTIKSIHTSYTELWVGQYDSQTKKTTWYHGPVNFSNIQTTDNPVSKVTQTTPSGTSDNTPLFSWEQDANATWYYLFVWDNAEKKVHTEWYNALDICSGSLCSVSIGSQLADDSYEWWIKSWNESGSVWSDGMSFIVQPAHGPPSKAIQIAPSGKSSNMPFFSWNDETSATWYYLFVWDSTEKKVHTEWYNALDICSGNLCSVSIGSQLADDSYAWWIKTWNEYGSIWSDGMTFSVSP